ncbi:MAG: extracellular solute-binding protein [Bacillota bacterium]|nr:extracellular solute-binding protein [Bacillota bacterium]
MKQTPIKILSMAIVLLFLFTLAACQGATTTTTTGTTKAPTGTTTTAATTTAAPTTTEPRDPVTITSLHSEVTVPIEQPSIVLKVRELTNIDWQPMLVGPADYATKLNSLIAARDLPDFFSFGLVNGLEYKQNGMLMQLNDLLTEYGPDIMENRGDYLGTGLNTADEIWGIPTPPGYHNALAVRTDWLANVGLDMPETLDEFYEVLKAFTENDPNKSGSKDTIGLAANILYPTMWQPVFGAYDIAYKLPVMVDGVVTSHLLHPDFLKVVEFFRTLYQEGLMEPDFATMPQMSTLEKLWNGTYGVMGFTPVGTTNNWMPGRYVEDPPPTFGWAIIKGPDGKGGFNKSYATGYYGLASTTEEPEEAMKLANFLGSPEGDQLLYFGIEGKHFEWVDEAEGKYKYLAPYDDSATQRADGGFIFWGLFRRWNDNAEIRTMNPTTREGLELSRNNPVSDAYIFQQPAIAIDLGNTLTDIENEALANLVVSTGDIEAEYAAYVQRWLNEGGETWQQQATAIYKAENP